MCFTVKKNIYLLNFFLINRQDSSSYSEIASCNYEARKFGVKNGMFFGNAKQLCPDIV